MNLKRIIGYLLIFVSIVQVANLIIHPMKDPHLYEVAILNWLFWGGLGVLGIYLIFGRKKE